MHHEKGDNLARHPFIEALISSTGKLHMLTGNRATRSSSWPNNSCSDARGMNSGRSDENTDGVCVMGFGGIITFLHKNSSFQ